MSTKQFIGFLELGQWVKAHIDRLIPRVGDSGPVNFRNKIINGGFEVNQRGIWKTVASDTFQYGSFDKWAGWANPGESVEFGIPGTYPNGGVLGIVRQTAGTGHVAVVQRIENVQTIEGVATVSFDYRSEGVMDIPFSLYMVQRFGSGGSADVVVGVLTGKLIATNGWQRATWTVELPSTDSKTVKSGSHIELGIRLDAGVTAPSSNALLVRKMQLEKGSVATPFEERPYGLELLLCRRYFRELVGCVGRIDVEANKAVFGVTLDPPMRATPTVSFNGGNQIHEMSVSIRSISSIVLTNIGSGGNYIRVSMTSNGTPGNLCNLERGVFLDAEL